MIVKSWLYVWAHWPEQRACFWESSCTRATAEPGATHTPESAWKAGCVRELPHHADKCGDWWMSCFLSEHLKVAKARQEPGRLPGRQRSTAPACHAERRASVPAKAGALWPSGRDQLFLHAEMTELPKVENATNGYLTVFSHVAEEDAGPSLLFGQPVCNNLKELFVITAEAQKRATENNVWASWRQRMLMHVKHWTSCLTGFKRRSVNVPGGGDLRWSHMNVSASCFGQREGLSSVSKSLHHNWFKKVTALIVSIA